MKTPSAAPTTAQTTALSSPLPIGDAPLDIETVREIALRDARVGLSPLAERRMAVSRAVVDRHLTEGRPVYGLTRGLGP
jgi:histidine ammonia-lyase